MFNFEQLKRLTINQPLAIILAGGLGSLAITRELGKHGVPIIVLGKEKYLITSKYSLGILIKNNEEIMEFLEKLPRYVPQKSVLFTDNESHLRLLGQHWEKLKHHYLAPFGPNNQQITDKTKLYGVAKLLGLFVPKIYWGIEEIREFPVIVKPADDAAHLNPFICKAYECKNQNELLSTYQQFKQIKVKAFGQQIIAGGVEDLYSITLYRSPQGKILHGYSLRKIRQYPEDYGTGTSHRTWEEPKVIEYSQRLLDAVEFVGVAEIEYKFCSRTKEFYLIEVNGRFPLHISMAHSLSNEFIIKIYQDLISELKSAQWQAESLHITLPNSLHKSLTVKPVIWTFLFKDFLAAKSKLNLLAEYLKYLFKARIQGAIWATNDIKPVFYFYYYLLMKLLKERKREGVMENMYETSN